MNLESQGSILDVPGLGVAHATDSEGLTGCTVLVCEHGAVAGVDVRGSAPGTRETDLLNPINLVQRVHAICLCGGSAFGLEAATGVMQLLSEHGIGLAVGVAVVPIVPAAVLFDLALGSVTHPSAHMGYEAAGEALAVARAGDKPPLAEGTVGAGTGASVGKVLGMDRAVKSGIGMASRVLDNGLVVAALVAVNAVGDVYHPETHEQLAGPRSESGAFLDTVECLVQRSTSNVPPGTNTTIGIVASNATFTKAQATKVAQMAHDGLARTIRPIHTMFDGDTIFSVATGGIDDASVDLVGSLSADLMATAVARAVMMAESAGGVPSWQALRGSL